MSILLVLACVKMCQTECVSQYLVVVVVGEIVFNCTHLVDYVLITFIIDWFNYNIEMSMIMRVMTDHNDKMMMMMK